MPSSTYKIINQTVENVLKINPSSILDIGSGFGKYGFLCREYLECWKDNVLEKQWKVTIDGIEIFEPYTKLSHNQSIYNNIYVGDMLELLPELPKYDLIIAMDVLEHVAKEEGEEVFFLMAYKCNKAMIVNVPTGNWLNNKVVANNPAEAHQAIWTEEDLIRLGKESGLTYELHTWTQNGRTGCLGVFTK